MDTQRLLNTTSYSGMLTSAICLEERHHSFPRASNDTSKRIPSPHPAPQLSCFQRFQETWMLELLGISCSAAGLVAIMIILLKYDGKQLPTWSISINAVISILSAVVSIGALYSVTHGVNQLKWVWLSENKRKLADIQAFDSGSRGVAGAIALLIHLQARYVHPTSNKPSIC